MSDRRRIAVLRAMAGLGLAVALQAGQGASDPDVTAWKAASPEYRLRFPRDHGSHPDYRVEWWYYVGNLEAPDGRRFGYQVTFFRVGVVVVPVVESPWAVRDLFMAHLAVTDLGADRFLRAERVNRAGPGWAGAEVGRYRVWNDGWEVALEADGTHHLVATADESDGGRTFGVDLQLVPLTPLVEQGTDGFSRKGRVPGNASHYYSIPRLDSSGTLMLDGEVVPVRGVSWMDHEFGSTFLEPGQRGWNWFALHLDDGTDVMMYDFLRADGRVDPYGSGSVIDAAGRVTRLTREDVVIEPTGRTWTSPQSGGRYPLEWRLRIPQADLALEVTTAVDDQEHVGARSGGVTYWEGAVTTTGTRAGRRVDGRGYLEMTGYAGPPIGRFLREEP